MTLVASLYQCLAITFMALHSGLKAIGTVLLEKDTKIRFLQYSKNTYPLASAIT
ncbi:hypothetical protein PAXRUDRAFT_825340 [Paxillus rubicundulus Ve08.2h10]|uniref:Uncharacterized protein n=1 Tax=Paxillus rubicundulus Ve08.2h10 TaxID=930991 RepID=A0A0D0DGI2_9AGAM|nr:hypothetical protein PAXRUDRAFT_825340 [Paxillus rubicundulus Ve08.2h10]